jgi:hypothetical protein
MLAEVDTNPRAQIGGNNPPSDAEVAFAAFKTNAEDLYAEAKNWLDGAAIATQGQADAISALLGMIREASGDIEKARKAEVKPLDDAKTAIQARYNELIGETKSVKGILVRATEACKAALVPWLRKQEDERRAEAERLRKEAAEKAAAAAEAARAASAQADLQAVEDAEALVKDAQAALKQANAADKSKARAGGADYRAVGLRSIWKPVLTDAGKALRHYAERNPEALKAFLLSLAEQDVRAGLKTIPGFEVREDRVAA